MARLIELAGAERIEGISAPATAEVSSDIPNNLPVAMTSFSGQYLYLIHCSLLLFERHLLLVR